MQAGVQAFLGGDDLVKAVQFGAGEMAKWFRALTVPPKDLHLIPSTNVTPHSRLTPLPGICYHFLTQQPLYVHVTWAYVQAKQSFTQKENK